MTLVSLAFLRRFLRFNVQIYFQFHGLWMWNGWIFCRHLVAINSKLFCLCRLTFGWPYQMHDSLLLLWELMPKHNHWWYFHWRYFFFAHLSHFLCAKKFVYDDRCARILCHLSCFFLYDRWSDDHRKNFCRSFFLEKCICVPLVAQHFMHFYASLCRAEMQFVWHWRHTISIAFLVIFLSLCRGDNFALRRDTLWQEQSRRFN